MQIQNVRFIIAAITTFSAYAVYVSRVNLSIAIIAMVDDRHSASTPHKQVERQANFNELSAHQHQLVLNSSQTELWKQYVRLKEEDERLNNRTTASADDQQQALFEAYRQQQLTLERVSSSNSQPKVGINSNNASTIQPNQQFLNANNIFLTSKKSFKAPLISQEKFHWDQSEQGHILGAFFYGYILFQIPGARMAESMGAKWIIMAASTGSAVISLAFPLSTQLNSIHLLMMLRFVMGLCQSAFFPAAYVLFCRWLPEKERSILLPIMFIGSNMGSISTYILSSYLISSAYGWPSVFYLSGLVCSICSLLWCIFGSNGPEDNWFITEKELLLIERNVNNQSSESNSLQEDSGGSAEDLEGGKVKKDQVKGGDCCNGAGIITPLDLNNNNITKELDSFLNEKTTKSLSIDRKENEFKSLEKASRTRTNITPTPSWSKLLKSAPMWIFILSMYGNEWSNVVICYELPTYLNSALNFPIEQNGVINSFFQLSYAVAGPIISSLGAYMLDRHLWGMRKIHVRKLFQSLATFGQMACFVSVPICGSNRGLIIMFMFLAIVFKTCANAGDIMVSGDLSPEYAGTIFAFANSIGNTAGVLVPALAGMLVSDAYQREQWTPFWVITAAIMCLSGLIFLIFGETCRQDYSSEEEEDKSPEKGDKPQHIELMECEQRLSASGSLQRNKQKQHQHSVHKLKPLVSS